MKKINEIIFEGGNNSEDILEQFISSDYYIDNKLNISKFLDKDKTIDLEKLELAIILLIEHLEKFVKFENPIYIILGNVKEYIITRGIQDNIKEIIEEKKFILGFSQAIANENKIFRDIIVRFES